MSTVQKFLLVVLAVFAASWAGAEVWDITPAFEGEPIDTDPVSEADNEMREIKLEVRRRLEPEHWFGEVGAPPGDDDNGLHRLGAARVFFQDAEPTALDGGAGDYENSVPTEQAETDLDNSASNSGGAIEDDVGHGRLWIDSNSAPDNILQVYMGVAGDGNGDWEDISLPVGQADDEILAGSYNFIYNGAFETVDGFGDDTVNCVACTDADEVPQGWTVNATTPDIDYVDQVASDIRWGDGYHVTVTGNGAANEEIAQVMTNLPAGTVFRVLVRADDDAGTVCQVNTTGADTDMANTDTTTDVWETVTGTFITAAALDTVTLHLITVTDGQVCAWDNVAVYQIGDVTTDRDEISTPSTVAMFDSDDTAAGVVPNWAAKAAVPNLTLDFTPPGPGWIIQVQANITVGDPAGAVEVSILCNLDNGGDVVGTASGVAIDVSRNPSASTISLGYLEVNPAPGTTITYTVECGDLLAGAGAGAPVEYNPDDSESSLWLIAHAPR